MSKTWRCGDCGTEYPNSIHYCTNTFHDYLAVHGGSVESAIQLAVDKAIEPLVSRAIRRLTPDPKPVWTPTIRVQYLPFEYYRNTT